MNIALWIVQILLAVAFFAAGSFKTFQPIDELVRNGMAYAADTPAWVTRLAGVSELLGAVGLILPSVTRVMPKLTAAAAGGLVTVMVLALGLHVSRGEFGAIVPNIVLGALAGFVVWGRLVKSPIEPRG